MPDAIPRHIRVGSATGFAQCGCRSWVSLNPRASCTADTHCQALCCRTTTARLECVSGHEWTRTESNGQPPGTHPEARPAYGPACDTAKAHLGAAPRSNPRFQGLGAPGGSFMALARPRLPSQGTRAAATSSFRAPVLGKLVAPRREHISRCPEPMALVPKLDNGPCLVRHVPERGSHRRSRVLHLRCPSCPGGRGGYSLWGRS